MKSFELIRELVVTKKLDPIKHAYPVGFSIMGSGKILLKFTSTMLYNFDSFDELDEFVLQYLKDNFGIDR